MKWVCDAVPGEEWDGLEAFQKMGAVEVVEVVVVEGGMTAALWWSSTRR